MSVAVVTGSSSGIGRATAYALASQGYSLVIHAKSNLEGLQETAAQIQKVHGQQVLCVTADIANPQMCKELVDTAFDWQGDIDVWVNNAGADVLKPPTRELDFEQKLKMLFEIDVHGTIRLSRLVAGKLSKQSNPHERLVINIGWDQADLGMENEAGQLFCTAKSAIQAFTKSLALTYPIRVNCVAPGWIKTSWGESSASSYWDNRAKKEALLERWGRAEDVANAVVWLASSHACFVNGVTLNVNGGRRFWPDTAE